MGQKKKRKRRTKKEMERDAEIERLEKEYGKQLDDLTPEPVEASEPTIIVKDLDRDSFQVRSEDIMYMDKQGNHIVVFIKGIGERKVKPERLEILHGDREFII
jgi:hypothetical protein